MLLMGSPREEVLAEYIYIVYLDRSTIDLEFFALHWYEKIVLLLCVGKEGGSGKLKRVSPGSE